MLRALFRRYHTGNITRADFSGKKRTVSIGEIAHFLLPADNLNIDVHLFDTPGYGDQINNQHAIDNVKTYLLNAHFDWLQIDGNHFSDYERNQRDSRMHLLFYFIAPHRVKEIDKEFMKQLSGLANIVPIISKSDTMTLMERADHLLLLQSTLQQLQHECGNVVPTIFDFEEEMNHPGYFLPQLFVHGFVKKAEGHSLSTHSIPPDSPNHEMMNHFNQKDTLEIGVEYSYALNRFQFSRKDEKVLQGMVKMSF
jgi:hypothetical protein